MKQQQDRIPCSATVFGERVQSWKCQKRGIVERAGKWYCKIHDPEFKKQKEQAWREARNREEAAENEIEVRAKSLVRALGCGRPYFHHGYTEKSGLREFLLLSFDEVNRLLKRLDARRSPND